MFNVSLYRAGHILKGPFKQLLGLIGGMSHSKDQRDIFIDLVEKVIDPWLQLKCTSAEIGSFFTEICVVYEQSCKKKHFAAFNRVFLKPILLLIIKMMLAFGKTCVLFASVFEKT